MMNAEQVKVLAAQAGAKIFGERIVVADQGQSGLATEFVFRFARLIKATVTSSNNVANDATFNSTL